jgi:RNA polymerase sigma factor (sigma-70 family)
MQDTPQIAEKWRRFKKTGCPKTRAELVEHYLPLAAGTARAVMVGASPRVRFDELEAAAQLGLVQAVDAYRLDRGAGFKTFSWLRMRGAIVDWQRSMAWGPRYARDDVPAVQGLDAPAYDVPDSSNPVRSTHLTEAARRSTAYTSRANAEVLWAAARGELGSEIGRRLGLSESCVSSRRHKGAAEIRACCNHEDYVWD